MRGAKHLKLAQLDDMLAPYRRLPGKSKPGGGWIRSIRDALGMPATRLAARLKITRQSLEDLEQNEASGRITLESLERVARALGCKVVYAVVPEDGKTLARLKHERAVALAREQLARVSHSMKLEAQGVASRGEKRQLGRLVDEFLSGSPRKLWR